MSLKKTALFSERKKKCKIGDQPLEPVNIKSSVTSRDNTALLCQVAAYVQLKPTGQAYPPGDGEVVFDHCREKTKI